MNKGLFFLKCAVLGVIAVSVIGLVTMLLWNWLVPALFKGPEIDFWQALGLLVLSKLLFWGFHGKRHAHANHGSSPYWKHRFYEKFSNLPASEREAFKQKMKEKWCRWEQKSSENPPASND